MIGVLLVNLGTPLSPSVGDVRRYLTEFLTDERVIDKSWWFRQLLVRGAIIPKRARNSAHAYASVWLPDGSPLMIHTRNQCRGLQEKLGPGYQVEMAMRYQSPSIEEGLEKLKGVEELIILPLFPQQASATTGSIIDRVMKVLKGWMIHPHLRIIPYFHNHPAYIEAQTALIARYHPERYDALILSFHGLPERHIKKGDCYAAHCKETSTALAKGLKHQKIFTTYQSRLGREAWLKPYTTQALDDLLRDGVKKILIACPAFVSDCLETLEEMGMGEKKRFLSMGGEALDLVPCLNAEPAWIEALAQIVQTPGALRS